MRKFLAFACLAAGWAAPAQAETVCVSWDTMKADLAARYHEVEVGGGFLNSQAVMVVLMSPGGSTWTIAALGTDGKACVVAAGVDWFQRSIPNPDERGS